VIAMHADQLLVETVDRLFVEHCTQDRLAASEGRMDAVLWNATVEMGLTSVGVPEALNGSGGSLHDAAAILTATGYHAAPAPIADTLAAGLCGSASGHALSEGVAVIGLPGRRATWAGVATWVVTADGYRAVGDIASEDSGHTYAGEPVRLLGSGSWVAAPYGAEVLALARSLQLAGGLQRVSELCVQYSMEREQFGKPIGKQQIIQHYLAQLAGDAATAQAAADNAVDVWAVNGLGDEFVLAVAAAKAVSSNAVGSTNRLAHQLHGAIGYTDEHRLQYWTRRLWSWRDDAGTETEWAATLGRAMASKGGSNLWPQVTAWPPSH
jgi:acyl-CoA dehydrogenase